MRHRQRLYKQGPTKPKIGLQTHSQAQPVNSVLQHQRVHGNHATQRMLTNTVQRDDLPPVADGSTRNDASNRRFTDFDGKQFRVTGREPNRRIEEVKRTQTEEGDVVYYATGLVVGFNANKPVIDYYDEPVSLGDWYPQVTHLNGMNVQPEGGIRDAMSLQASINESLDESGDMALGQDAIDVLYTYSTTLNFVPDLWDALKGKLFMGDNVTDIQKQIMLDAVHNQQRTTVSAHSRGTIKTDNAVREAHAQLTEEFLPQIWEEVEESLSLNRFQRFLVSSTVRDLAETRAKEQMDMYIQLVYAGNAVVFPSTVLPIEFLVGSYDGVSIVVGSYIEWGVQDWGLWGHDESTLDHVSGGHSFQSTYSQPAGELIGRDIVRRQ